MPEENLYLVLELCSAGHLFAYIRAWSRLAASFASDLRAWCAASGAPDKESEDETQATLSAAACLISPVFIGLLTTLFELR